MVGLRLGPESRETDLGFDKPGPVTLVDIGGGRKWGRRLVVWVVGGVLKLCNEILNYKRGPHESFKMLNLISDDDILIHLSS